VLDFNAKMITVDEVILPMRNINHLQGASKLCALKLNHSLAMEPHSTQALNKSVTRILDAWCHLVLYQTHGRIPNNSESSPSPEQMVLCGNLVWRTFSKNC
jgi:hypothetical protein